MEIVLHVIQVTDFNKENVLDNQIIVNAKYLLMLAQLALSVINVKMDSNLLQQEHVNMPLVAAYKGILGTVAVVDVKKDTFWIRIMDIASKVVPILLLLKAQ